ncbi:MAG TPA: GtrA family protein [Terracidiphilus sp.]
MNAFVRWCKFNAVGALGMVFQLAVLAVVNRLAPGRYLAATAVAIELTLLHNFIWHLRYTWRDRIKAGTVLGKLVRFHLSNGLVSMVGNLGLMRLLVQVARVPVLQANGVAILVCSMVNFWLGQNWAFATYTQPSGASEMWDIRDHATTGVRGLPPLRQK